MNLFFATALGDLAIVSGGAEAGKVVARGLTCVSQNSYGSSTVFSSLDMHSASIDQLLAQYTRTLTKVYLEGCVLKPSIPATQPLGLNSMYILTII